MPPRISLPSMVRQCRSFVSQRVSWSSTTSGAFAPGPTNPAPYSSAASSSSSASQLIDVGSADRPTGPNAAQKTELLRGLLQAPQTREAGRRSRAENAVRTRDKLRQQDVSNAYLRQMPRRWAPGEVYAPHDLSPEEAKRYAKAPKPKFDVIDVLGINPLDQYQNFAFISEFMTPMGRIKHSKDTGLRAVNQRKVAKAIRRAIGLGIHPSVHRHPELLARLKRTVGREFTASRGNAKRL